MSTIRVKIQPAIIADVEVDPERLTVRLTESVSDIKLVIGRRQGGGVPVSKSA